MSVVARYGLARQGSVAGVKACTHKLLGRPDTGRYGRNSLKRTTGTLSHPYRHGISCKFVLLAAFRQTVYKGDTGGSDSLSVSTCIESGCCTVDLTVGEEYILGLSGSDGDFWASSCDVFLPWSEQSEAGLLECEEVDPCNGACVDPEVCLPADLR